jgi:hypothetical protein
MSSDILNELLKDTVEVLIKFDELVDIITKKNLNDSKDIWEPIKHVISEINKTCEEDSNVKNSIMYSSKLNECELNKLLKEMVELLINFDEIDEIESHYKYYSLQYDNSKYIQKSIKSEMNKTYRKVSLNDIMVGKEYYIYSPGELLSCSYHLLKCTGVEKEETRTKYNFKTVDQLSVFIHQPMDTFITRIHDKTDDMISIISKIKGKHIELVKTAISFDNAYITCSFNITYAPIYINTFNVNSIKCGHFESPQSLKRQNYEMVIEELDKNNCRCMI